MTTACERRAGLVDVVGDRLLKVWNVRLVDEDFEQQEPFFSRALRHCVVNPMTSTSPLIKAE